MSTPVRAPMDVCRWTDIRPVSALSVPQDSDRRPAVVQKRIGAIAVDIRLYNRGPSVVEEYGHRLVVQECAPGLLILGYRAVQWQAVCRCHEGVDRGVGVSRSSGVVHLIGRRREEVVEPVLRIVVVSQPASAEKGQLPPPPGSKEAALIQWTSRNVQAQVRLPLVVKVPCTRDQEGSGRTVAVDQASKPRRAGVE